MALVVQTNVGSMIAQSNLAKSTAALQTVFQRLSSGYRINSAADDAAGLGVSMNLVAQNRSMAVAERNTNDGISMLQTSDGAAAQVGDVLTRMRELAVQSSNGTLASSDRANISVEFTQLQSEISRLGKAATFNGNNMLDGTTSTITLQVGAGTTTNDALAVSVVDATTGSYTALTASGLGLNGGGNSIGGLSLGGTASMGLATLSTIDAAISSVAATRAVFGALQNRLQNVITGLQTKETNYAAANSRIKDVDVASETANLARYQVLQQAGETILSQANQAPQSALSLLR